MTSIDWTIVVLYVAAALGIGLYFARRAGAGTAEFFVAGRSLPWYVAGTSMVATTFSSDTPLFVAGIVRDQGIYANWIWWSGAIGTLVSVFFFANLWRRTRAMTEIEFIAQRYDAGAAADALRVFRALFDGVFVNCIIMASVTLAMSKIIVVILGLSATPLFDLPLLGDVTPAGLILVGLGLAAVLYTALSGLYGVVYTDLIQFVLAMIGAIALAIIVYVDLSGSGGAVAALHSAPGFKSDTLNLLPEFGWDLKTITFLILITVGWWYAAPGAGFFLQRVLATRVERDAMLSLYWFGFCHFVLRSWPWIVVGLASLVYFPNLADGEQAYPEMIQRFLPVGLKGIMVASLLAAFMSTLDTHMNWGSSYLVNDVYRPFLAPGRSPRHYVRAARAGMLLLVLTALAVSTVLTDILSAYQYLGVVLTGTAFVMIARWYWWRINVWSEIASLLTAAAAGNALLFLLPDRPGEEWFAVRMLITVGLTMLVCVAVTLATSNRGPTPQAIAFYKRLRIHGRGWGRVRKLTGVPPVSARLRDSAIACVASIVVLYACLMGVGYLLFGDWLRFAASLLLGLPCGYIAHRKLRGVIAQLRTPVTD